MIWLEARSTRKPDKPMTSEENFGSPTRKPGFDKAAALFLDNGGKVIVETGCYHYQPQGNSTFHLAKLAESCTGELHSVDTNPDHIKTASESVAGIKTVQFHQCDSVAFLSQFQRQIDLLYLDSLDFDKNCPIASRLHNLAEMGAAIGKMSEHGVVLIDDWNWGDGEWTKPFYTKTFLEYRKWRLVLEDYQLVFVKP
jgi:hypothetical protein